MLFHQFFNIIILHFDLTLIKKKNSLNADKKIILFHIHSSGGIILFLIRYILTVIPLEFSNLGECYHSFGGTIPFFARVMATVSPFLSFNVGS